MVWSLSDIINHLSRGEAALQLLFFAYMVFKQLSVFLKLGDFSKYLNFWPFLKEKFPYDKKIGYCQEVVASLRWHILLSGLPQSLLPSLVLLTPRPKLSILSCLSYYFKEKLRIKVGYLLYSCSHWKLKNKKSTCLLPACFTHLYLLLCTHDYLNLEILFFLVW